ncbi:hypothetical protein [Phytoactinopolyspora halotolerans]|uniref:Uncharacterized protein n=1 Tax=Phytoactinopolyspora halotolerans TaxID=1981512 RepID=A0A6L9SCP4_9ACTN|nr:hypothetical protein [Phytoactinopolyspora halotolerans]NEE02996.1 hypothetical protein [Phytoactinopolyspora halotolerans]
MSNRGAELRELAHRLNDAGPEAVEDELSELARMAAAVGVEPALLAALCDRAAPAVVRQRAFARVAARVDARLDALTVRTSSDRQDSPEAGYIEPRPGVYPGGESQTRPTRNVVHRSPSR